MNNKWGAHRLRFSFTVLLFLTLLSGMATPAAAIPYTVFIESTVLGKEWTITGFFESSTDTWSSPLQISNYSFSGQITSPPALNVGPLIAPGAFQAFAGSAASGITALTINRGTAGTLLFVETSPGNIYTATFASDSSPRGFNGETKDITNTVTAIPIPRTDILFLLGLAGLIGYRWLQSRHAANETRI